jgi:cell division septum initiation protein DivIVA
MPPARRDTGKDSLAGAASERVRAIIEAAEASAEAIRTEAQAEADRITAEAEERASALRSEVRGDVEALIASIRDGFDKLRGDLEALEQRLAEPDPMSTSAPTSARAPDPELEPDIALAADAAIGPDESQTVAAADTEGARLVALNMALDGASREDVALHLRENHGLSDPGALLDEVYESIGRS